MELPNFEVFGFAYLNFHPSPPPPVDLFVGLALGKDGNGREIMCC